jgi:Transposase IS116/IS110/IS902 family
MEASAPAPPVCQRLEPIPGVGPLPATALRAAVREVSACQQGRQVAAWWGLGPRQPATGGKARCRGSRTRGAGSRRPLLVPGARATLRGGGRKPERRRKGGRALMEWRGKTKPAVARAHKHAPMAWVLLNRDPTYRDEEITPRHDGGWRCDRSLPCGCEAHDSGDATTGRTGCPQPWFATRPQRSRLS